LKQVSPDCNCKQLKCFDKISNEARVSFHKKYWELGDKKDQWIFLVSYTQKYSDLGHDNPKK
jgi:hypothetical protein